MEQTSLYNMKFSGPDGAAFIPVRGLANPHLQTLLPRLLRRTIRVTPHWQRLDLPDGDFVDLAWSEDPQFAQHKPRVVLFHGLEGSFHSPYIHGLMQVCKQRGWLAVVMHFRGCSGEPNRLNRIYHSGETEDARFFLNWLTTRWGRVPTAAVGFSLGGNMLGCLLGQQGNDAVIDAGVIVSAPLLLEPCSARLERGFSQVYQRYLLSQLKKNAQRKLHAWPDTLPIDLKQLSALRRLRDFDDAITARAHGFADATDYYHRASAMPLLRSVAKPLLIIHAKDDPFMSDEVIPQNDQLSATITYQLTRHGGHVGFVGGTLRQPQLWLEQRVPQWISPYLDS
ncbi:hydrolase [Pantoea allii]|uniref:hydrolase n=1 Tax=Pantoea allii TaxID=574096 RepID=UPI000A223884|nr:hydrolase [Pantoea allii]MBW1254329.1 hydrolase [Pantoea allii]MBW1263282.1 hydrolase [Pantoea allii]MBW1285159.1 hydrolase [Pantoea allii]MDJ0037789.1 hydrolase [Pantoea allii]NQS84708.1 hydrolase [Pantoea allii]